MDVQRLRLLREVAERGTVTAAALAVSLTPSAVSQQLKVLAREAGVPLLERSGRRIRLTQAGTALVQRADEVVAALDAAREEMDAYKQGPRGRLSVAMFPTGAAILLPKLIIEADRRGIDIDGRDIDRPAQDAAALLADFDLVVVHQDERDPMLKSNRLSVTELFREPLEVVLPVDHRLARQQEISIDDLAHEPWIGVEDGFMVDDVLSSIGKISGVYPRIVQRVNDFRVTEELVAAGLGVAVVPQYVRLARPLVRRPLAQLRAARRIAAVRRAHITPRPTVEEAVSILLAIARDAVT